MRLFPAVLSLLFVFVAQVAHGGCGTDANSKDSSAVPGSSSTGPASDANIVGASTFDFAISTPPQDADAQTAMLSGTCTIVVGSVQSNPLAGLSQDPDLVPYTLSGSSRRIIASMCSSNHETKTLTCSPQLSPVGGLDGSPTLVHVACAANTQPSLGSVYTFTGSRSVSALSETLGGASRVIGATYYSQLAALAHGAPDTNLGNLLLVWATASSPNANGVVVAATAAGAKVVFPNVAATGFTDSGKTDTHGLAIVVPGTSPLTAGEVTIDGVALSSVPSSTLDAGQVLTAQGIVTQVVY